MKIRGSSEYVHFECPDGTDLGDDMSFAAGKRYHGFDRDPLILTINETPPSSAASASAAGK